MNTILRTVALTAFSALTILPLTVTSARAQTKAGQQICFSFDGAGKLTGKDNTGTKSKTGVRVGGTSFFVGGTGATTSDCATQLVAQLTAAGYTASKSAANVVCVTAGKGGAPLTTGGIIGSTDTGLEGIDCSVEPAPPNPNKLPPKKTLKTQGVKVPQVRPGVSVTVTQTITIEVEIEKVVNGKKVTVKIKIDIKVTRGMNAQQANDAMRNAFRRAGLCFTEIVRQSPFLNVPIPSFGFEFDCFGNPVHHVILWQPLQPELFPMEISAGDVPMFGGTVIGRSSGVLVPPGMHLGLNGYPGIGMPFQPFVHGGFPGGSWIPVLGLEDPNGGLPFLGGDLLLDPRAMVILPPQPLSPLGQGNLQIPIPPDPRLVGQDLMLQGLVLDPSRKNSALTNGLKLTVGK